MKIKLSGHNMVGLGKSFPNYVNDSTNQLVNKYLKNKAVSAKVLISKNRNKFKSSIIICQGGKRHYLVKGDGHSDTPYGAYNIALEKMSTGLRRLKRRLSSY